MATIYIKLNNMKKYLIHSSMIYECIVKYTIMNGDNKHYIPR